MKKKNIMREKEKEIKALQEEFEAIIITTQYGTVMKGTGVELLALIATLIESMCERLPKELVRNCLEIAFHDDKEKAEMIKKEKKKSKELDKLNKLLDKKLKKKEADINDLKEVLDTLEKIM